MKFKIFSLNLYYSFTFVSQGFLAHSDPQMGLWGAEWTNRPWLTKIFFYSNVNNSCSMFIYRSIVLVIPSTRSSLARERPMGLGRCGVLVENKPTFLPPNLGGQTLDRANSFSFLWNTNINLK